MENNNQQELYDDITILSEDNTDEVEQLKKKVAEMTALAQSIKAEFDNYRKRTALQAKTSKEQGKAELIEELLPVLDAFNQATQVISDKSVLDGVNLILKRLESVLTSAGLCKVESLGTEFNPEIHEAVMMREECGKSGLVVEVIQDGYMLSGKVLRAAKVIVAS